MIKKVLVANRGEIALRVMRACREMGISTVAVYSEADRHALHAEFADEAVLIGPAESQASYLQAETILRVAAETGADAIHPGYGFLSEKAEFSAACAAAGIAFIGPPASAMQRLGSKIEAKQLAVENGVPVTPGFFEPGATLSQLRTAADEIGYPIMLKASAGGGGRGMRIVREPFDFDSAFELATQEAVSGFGDGAMMVERLVDRPRHIEVQVLADQHGNVACLFERECSIQRRHQKLVEEAPSPIMTDDLWQRMQTACRSLVKAAGYTGAGTVEFMYDQERGEFYFLEVNARLQVEHPVTEAITGIDLVHWQIRIAQGEPLALPTRLMTGDRSAINGHSIEVRLVAEDPAKNFMPSVGPLLGWAEPRGPGIRFDTGYSAGREISRFYDSLVAKLIVHGEDRSAAIVRLRAALADTHILGVQTNIGYLAEVVAHPSFGSGEFDTGFLGREFADWAPTGEIPAELTAILKAGTGPSVAAASASSGPVRQPAWSLDDGFRITN